MEARPVNAKNETNAYAECQEDRASQELSHARTCVNGWKKGRYASRPKRTSRGTDAGFHAISSDGDKS